MSISMIQTALNTVRALPELKKKHLVAMLGDCAARTNSLATINAIQALIVLVEDERTLGRYPYKGEAQRSEAMSQARSDAEARRKNGENVQWRHIDDDTGVAYVVERLG